MQTVKNALKSRFLFDYRNVPHSTTGVSSAFLMSNRNLRTIFQVLLPPDKGSDKVMSRVRNVQARQKRYYQGKAKVKFYG